MTKTLQPVIGPENAAWAERINAAIKAGEKPAYADFEEAVTHLLNENRVLKDYNRQSQKVLARMVLARHQNNTSLVLAALDIFIKQHVTLKTAEPAKKPH